LRDIGAPRSSNNSNNNSKKKHGGPAAAYAATLAKKSKHSNAGDEHDILKRPHAANGSTCTMVIFDAKRAQLHVAHIGDSRALIFNSKKHLRYETRDHNAGDLVERSRIEGVNKERVVNGRVFAKEGFSLNVTRAFGDLIFKQNSLQRWRDQVVSAWPDYAVVQLPLDEITCVYMASDGVWNFNFDPHTCGTQNASDINHQVMNHCLNVVLPRGLPLYFAQLVAADRKQRQKQKQKQLQEAQAKKKNASTAAATTTIATTAAAAADVKTAAKTTFDSTIVNTNSSSSSSSSSKKSKKAASATSSSKKRRGSVGEKSAVEVLKSAKYSTLLRGSFEDLVAKNDSDTLGSTDNITALFISFTPLGKNISHVHHSHKEAGAATDKKKQKQKQKQKQQVEQEQQTPLAQQLESKKTAASSNARSIFQSPNVKQRQLLHAPQHSSPIGESHVPTSAALNRRRSFVASEESSDLREFLQQLTLHDAAEAAAKSSSTTAPAAAATTAPTSNGGSWTSKRIAIPANTASGEQKNPATNKLQRSFSSSGLGFASFTMDIGTPPGQETTSGGGGDAVSPLGVIDKTPSNPNLLSPKSKQSFMKMSQGAVSAAEHFQLDNN
jgi:serine/threonine protein phosphatase PrpC